MITLVVCIKRHASFSQAEFSRYWREHHGPLVNGCADFARHLLGYSQYHLVDGANDAAEFGIPAGYDGVARLTFASMETMAQAFAEPAYLADVRPDEPRFIDIDACMSFVTQEYAVI